MARKSTPKSFGNKSFGNKSLGKPRGLVVVVAKPDRGAERMRSGEGHKLGGRPHAADSRRDLGRDPMKSDRKPDFLKRDPKKG